ncbi:MAG: 5-formyltetrahydrofolate cyclo-ligase [Turicibacter sp.]|nr:5-formyltetrahydrofolate cyclo-ligase [Turicibacter sp.]
MEKNDLRSAVMAELKAHAGTCEKKQGEAMLYGMLFATPQWQNAKTIGTTISMGFEVDTGPIIHQAFKEGKAVALPRVESPGLMAFYLWQAGDPLIASKFGILEPDPLHAEKIPPECIGLLVVPGIAFGLRGFRIGFGGGFYDRYLAAFHGDTVALALPWQIRSGWVSGIHDIPVGLVLQAPLH